MNTTIDYRGYTITCTPSGTVLVNQKYKQRKKLGYMYNQVDAMSYIDSIKDKQLKRTTNDYGYEIEYDIL